ncbi:MULTISPECIES: hypothetical protein [unclassified Kitasatospora]|uniref:hypothetical protein n=1 Tax=unclassified Kitasatospora TaxID=2633591 RepID=UPI0033C9C45D
MTLFPQLGGPPQAAGGSPVPGCLRLVDRRTETLVEVPASGRGRLLRVGVHLSGDCPPVGPTDLRAMLVGDVLLRAAESGGAQVLHVLLVPPRAPREAQALERLVTAFGVHAPSDISGVDDANAMLGGPADIQLFAAGDGRQSAPEGVWAVVGPVLNGWSQGTGAALREDDSGTVTWGGVEPAAARLALLTHAHSEPFTLTSDRLADAERSLRNWRYKVADWARSPSAPVPEQVRLSARAAFTDDLDTPGALALLRRVEEDSGIPAGAKFEAFAAMDRVLGLELIRDIGTL